MQEFVFKPRHLGHLRWVAVLFPAAILGLFGYFHSRYLVNTLPRTINIAIMVTMITAGSYLFARWIFGHVERLAEENRQQAKRAQALLELAEAINDSSLGMKTILQRAVDLSRKHLRASYGEIHYLHEGAGVEEHGVRFSGLTPGSCPVKDCPTLGGLNGEVLRTGRAIRLKDRKDHPTTIGELPEGHPPVGAFLGVPIIVRGGVEADLLLIRLPEDPPFTQEEEDFLQTIAHQTAAAVENARLYGEIRHLAVLEERDRLGREVHDGLAQTLGFLNLRLKAANTRVLKNQNDDAADLIEEARQVVKETYEEVRRTIFDLRSGISPDLALLPALEDYLYEFGLQCNIETDLQVTGNENTRFLPETEVQLVRIIQESLSNVRKHAEAKHVWVTIDCNERMRRVIIADDGKGFQHQENGRSRNGRPHFGLQSMRERAESIGARLSIESEAGNGNGTRVVVELPRSGYYEQLIMKEL